MRKLKRELDTTNGNYKGQSEYVCISCKKTFVSYDLRAANKYCSLKCKKNYLSQVVSCVWCKTQFKKYKSQKRKFCSKDCVYKSRTGEKSILWNGGKIKNKAGYFLIYSPEHPFKDKRGYVMEHRLVMEKSLNRILNPEEVVHHINEVKSDNRIENLQLMSKSEHRSHHAQLEKNPNWKGGISIDRKKYCREYYWKNREHLLALKRKRLQKGDFDGQMQ